MGNQGWEGARQGVWGQGTPAFSGAEGERRAGGRGWCPHPQLSGGRVSACPSVPRGRGRVQNGVFHHLSSPRIFPVPLAEALRLATEFPSCVIRSPLKLLPLLWFPGWVSVFELLNRSISDPHSTPGSHWFQSQMFWGPHLTGAGPRVGAPDVGHRQTLRSSGRGSAREIPPCCVGVLFSASPGGRNEFRVFVCHHLDPKWFLFSSNG